MSRTVENIIKNDCESQVLDFKREPYQLGKNPKKYELLKDFCAFVNNPSNLDKYIIIGVNEHEGRALSFRTVNNDVDEAGYQQYIYQNIEPPITFEYKSFQYQSYTLSYFRIFNNTKRPYLFKSDIKDPITNKLLFRIGMMV
jgi:predicted HTH transcriptional regulator